MSRILSGGVSQHALGRGCISQHTLGRGCLPRGGVHRPPDGHCSRLYASYWNAFLCSHLYLCLCFLCDCPTSPVEISHTHSITQKGVCEFQGHCLCNIKTRMHSSKMRTARFNGYLYRWRGVSRRMCIPACNGAVGVCPGECASGSRGQGMYTPLPHCVLGYTPPPPLPFRQWPELKLRW